MHAEPHASIGAPTLDQGDQILGNLDEFISQGEHELAGTKSESFALSELVLFAQFLGGPELHVAQRAQPLGDGYGYARRGLNLREAESEAQVDGGFAPLRFFQIGRESDLIPLQGRTKIRLRKDHRYRSRD